MSRNLEEFSSTLETSFLTSDDMRQLQVKPLNYISDLPLLSVYDDGQVKKLPLQSIQPV